jgi:hypothetical protein
MEASIEHYRSPEAVLAAARAQQVRVYSETPPASPEA